MQGGEDMHAWREGVKGMHACMQGGEGGYAHRAVREVGTVMHAGR